MPKGIRGRVQCAIEGCDKTVHARGWCKPHYGAWRRRGDPRNIGQPRRRQDPAARFWKKVERGTADECWLWAGALTPQGYGSFRSARERSECAHRVAYELLIGPIPEGLPLDHLCRTPRCVNPSHLEPVTHRENILRGTGQSARNARKTHCKWGHEFTTANTRLQRRDGRVRRVCLICRDRNNANRYRGKVVI